MKIFTWKQRLVVFSTTLLIIGSFLLVGYLIGRWFEHTRAGVFLAVLASYPVTQWVLVKRIRVLHEREKIAPPPS
jgi:ABC-type iron transport system FetAB permease component